MNSNQPPPKVGQQPVFVEGRWMHLHEFADLIIKADDVGKARLVHSLERSAEATQLMQAQAAKKPPAARKRVKNAQLLQIGNQPSVPTVTIQQLQQQYPIPQGTSLYQLHLAATSNKLVEPSAIPHSPYPPTHYNQTNVPMIPPPLNTTLSAQSHPWSVPPLGANQRVIVLPQREFSDQFHGKNDTDLPRAPPEQLRSPKLEKDASRSVWTHEDSTRFTGDQREALGPPRMENEAPRVKIKLRVGKPGGGATTIPGPTMQLLPETTVTPHLEESSSDDAYLEPEVHQSPPPEEEEIKPQTPPRKNTKISLVCNRPSTTVESTPASDRTHDVSPAPTARMPYTPANTTPARLPSAAPMQHNTPVPANMREVTNAHVPSYSPPSSLYPSAQPLSRVALKNTHGPVIVPTPTQTLSKITNIGNSNWFTLPHLRPAVPSVTQQFGSEGPKRSNHQEPLRDVLERRSYKVSVTSDYSTPMQRIDVSRGGPVPIPVDDLNLPLAPIPISPLLTVPQMVTLLPTQCVEVPDDYKPLEEIDWDELNSVPLTQGYWPLHTTAKVSLSPLSTLKRRYYDKNARRVTSIGTTCVSRMNLWKGLKRTFSAIASSSEESVDTSDVRETKRIKVDEQAAVLDLTLSSQKSEHVIGSPTDRALARSGCSNLEDVEMSQSETFKESTTVMIHSKDEDDKSQLTLSSPRHMVDVVSYASEDMWSADSADRVRQHPAFVSQESTHERSHNVSALKEDTSPCQLSEQEDEPVPLDHEDKPVPLLRVAEPKEDPAVQRSEQDEPQLIGSEQEDEPVLRGSEQEEESAPTKEAVSLLTGSKGESTRQENREIISPPISPPLSPPHGDDHMEQASLIDQTPPPLEAKKTLCQEAQSSLVTAGFSRLAPLLNKRETVDTGANGGIANKLAGFLQMEERIKFKQEELKNLFDEYQKKHHEIEQMLQPLMGSSQNLQSCSQKPADQT